MFDKKSSKFHLVDLVISMLGITVFILMFFIMTLVPNNHLGIDHIVFGGIAGSSGLSILIDHVRKKFDK
jgi:hypothetical protein